MVYSGQQCSTLQLCRANDKLTRLQISAPPPWALQGTALTPNIGMRDDCFLIMRLL